MDVRRVQPGLAAVVARPLAASGRSGARRCGSSCGAPSTAVAKNVRDVVVGEEVGRAVRAVEHADLPLVAELRDRAPSAARAAAATAPAARPVCSTSPARSARPPWPPNCPSVKVARLPRYARHVDAAAHGEVGAAAGAAHVRRARSVCAGRHVDGATSAAAARRRASRPCRRRSARSTASRGTAASARSTVNSSAGGAVGLPTQAVGEPERQRVHRPRRRHADVPVAEPAGIVLHGGLRAGVEHLDASRRVRHVLEQARGARCRRANAGVGQRPARR